MPIANTDQLLETIAQTLLRLPSAYNRLVLIVGQPMTGKTSLLRELQGRTNYPLLNVNLEIAQRLLDHTIAERPRLVPDLFAELVRTPKTDAVLLDNLEILFDAAFLLNPLQMLQSLSRNISIVATWSGAYRGDELTYAEPGHPEFQQYRLAHQDAIVFPISLNQ